MSRTDFLSHAVAPCEGSEIPRLRLAQALLGLTLALFAHFAPAQVIKLGHTSSPSNGLVGAFSREYNAGIQMAVDRINANGGVRGALHWYPRMTGLMQTTPLHLWRRWSISRASLRW